MSNSSTHPCAFCRINKTDLGVKHGLLRTIGTIAQNSTLWKAQGGTKKTAKTFFNCINAPLFHGNEATRILDVCAPPSLHILLGLMNTLYNAVAEYNPEIAQSWAAASGATRHAQFGFTGRHCYSLLAKQNILNNGDATLKQYTDALDQFRNVIDSCFGINLLEDFQRNITEFCKAWKAARLPNTPKFHIMDQHVAEFCESKQVGLSIFSEQTTEAIHKDFSKKWENFKVPKTNPDFSKKLLSCIVSYNSLHVT